MRSFCRCHLLHRRARHLPSLPSPLFGRRACCSRPRRRAEPFALAFACDGAQTRRPAPPCTPARARVEPGVQVEPWPLSSRVGLAAVPRPASTAAASPWPRAPCSVSSRRGKGEPCPWPPRAHPATAVNPHELPRANRGRRARRHPWRRAGLRREHRRDAPSRPQPCPPAVVT
jgi:hypothetical protein